MFSTRCWAAAARLAGAESRITAFTAIPSTIAPNVVAEPIELPKTTTALGLRVARSQATTASRSYRSCTPSVVSVPPLWPWFRWSKSTTL